MWKLFLSLGTSLFIMGASSCSTPFPTWEGKIYAGSFSDRAMVRKQANEYVYADKPEFNELMGMKWKGDDGFEGFYRTYVLGCEKWKPGIEMTTIEKAYNKLINNRNNSDTIEKLSEVRDTIVDGKGDQ